MSVSMSVYTVSLLVCLCVRVVYVSGSVCMVCVLMNVCRVFVLVSVCFVFVYASVYRRMVSVSECL